VIGQPVSRIDGPLKVTGRATYAYETWDVGQPLYGYIVSSTIARGRIARIDISRAVREPGVRRVFTHVDAPKQHAPDMKAPSAFGRALPVLASPEVWTYGQPVACVVATTFEQARSAAALVDVAYDKRAGVYELDDAMDRAFTPEVTNSFFAGSSAVGDFDAAFDGAAVKLDALYITPYVLAQPMEPHASLAVWNGDAVTLYTTTQIMSQAKLRIAATFGLDPRQVRVLSRYVGGGFGSKLCIHADAILAVMAARELKQPVKVAATRQQTFHLVGHRPMTRQRMRLGADRDGRLVAFGHDVIQKASAEPTMDYLDQTASTGRGLYAAPNRRTTTRAVPLDLPAAEDVRAPGHATGMLAIEAAMDELAHELGMDPIELRIRNEPTVHPEENLPFSSRRLVECFREGARRFGWDRRPAVPASVREGRRLVGYGVATASLWHLQAETTVRVRLAGGIAIVESDMTDIGTGTYTILAQVASEAFGIPIDRVRVELGDSDLPSSGGSGGSWGAANSCNALYRACNALRDKVLAAAPEAERSQPVVELAARYHAGGVEATGTLPGYKDAPSYSTHSLASYGAQFAEVHVDADTGEVRVRRMFGVFDAGRVLNAKTARSQLIGAMIGGLGAALLEEAVLDPQFGAFVNRDLAGYLVPVHADVRDIDAFVLDGFDDKANDLGARGLGELGICGAGAAIANAVFNATGVRVRDYPITIEKLLPHLPAV
jgi:xanthine dehydrogenase YagR molybdenum-binding subunit